METRLNKDTKVARQLPKVAWRDSAIDKLKITHSKLKGRADVSCVVTGNPKGAYIRWNTKNDSKTFIKKSRAESKNLTYKLCVYQ